MAPHRSIVLSDKGRPTEVDEIGELFVEGPCVMLGYWGRRDAFNEGRPYATGDLVSRRDDGALMYHGRRDQRVKLQGFRIELGDVESTLLSHPDIHDAVALVVDQQLICALASKNPGLTDIQVKQHCAAQIPRYMIPSDVRMIPSVPRTASGKVDRQRIEAWIREQDAALAKRLKESIWKHA